MPLVNDVTEEQALRMWCPASRVVDSAGNGGWNRPIVEMEENVQSLIVRSTLCHGRVCMWWRWSAEQPEGTPLDQPVRGYCGHGGPP